MATDLAGHIQSTPLSDTHEHLRKETEWVDDGPDILQDLFGNYVPADLYTAGVSSEAMKRLMDASDPDLAGRFEGVRDAWEATQFTGYGEAVRLIAEELYGMSELTADGLASAQDRLKVYRKPGGRHNLLSKKANLDHVQVDDFCWECLPDVSGPDFFLYDLSWAGFCNGVLDPEAIVKATGIEVVDLNTLQQGMEAIFEKYGPCAIAVKAQHAYNRTLRWEDREETDVSKALTEVLYSKDSVPEDTRLCLGN